MVKLFKYLILSVLFFMILTITIKAEDVDSISINESNGPVEVVGQDEVETPKQDESEKQDEQEQQVEQKDSVDDTTETTTSTETTEISNETAPVALTTEAPTETQDNEIPAVAEGNATAQVSTDEPTEGNATAQEPTTETETDEDIHGGVVYDIQKVKVVTSKVDADGNPLAGAKLQILDSTGTPVDTWVSGTEPHETLLPDGTYTLHEVEAPEGYVLAEDKQFTVKVEIVKVDAGSDASATPCPHYTGTQMYYVEIQGEKQEVYCINQNWETPDENSTYSGELLDEVRIRDYTKQTIPVGITEDAQNPVLSDTPLDVSDPTLNDEQLYDKILDIIYHRHTAAKALAERGLTYTKEEIRFITEVALKNYTNPGIAELQLNGSATDEFLAKLDAAGVIYQIYYDKGTKKVSYLKHNYRDFVYRPDVPLKQDIAIMEFGKGNSFGQMVANHWNSFKRTDHLHPDVKPEESKHDAKNKQKDRDTVARYYELFLYLIRDEDHHPEDMNLYIYSSDSIPSDLSGNDFEPKGKYQNLLGVTGYYEKVEQQVLEVNMTNEYSNETREIPVEKVWDDKEDYEHLRPTTVTVNLYADGELYETVELTAENEWKYTFKDLKVYNKGKKIIYTIDENKVVEYDTNIEGDMDKGFTIINSHYGTGGDEPPTDNPQTSDSIFIYITMLIISVLGLFKYSKLIFEE